MAKAKAKTTKGSGPLKPLAKTKGPRATLADVAGDLPGLVLTHDSANPRGRAPSPASVVPARFRDLVAAAVWLPRSEVARWLGNPRINKGAVPRIKLSLERFGFIAPLCVWTSKGRLVVGDTRTMAFDELVAEHGPSWKPHGAPGPGLVPVRFHEFRNEAEANAYAIADNRLGELAEWDETKLEEVMGDFADDPELFDATGFDHDEYFPENPDDGRNGETGAGGGGGGETGSDPNAAPPVPKETRTKLGDVWLLGKHRLICGDSRHADIVDRLVGEARMDLVWTDPPYGVSYVGKTKDALTIKNDELDDAELRAFLLEAFQSADRLMKPGAAFYVTHPPAAAAAAAAFFYAALTTGWHIAQGPVWVKDRFVLGRSDYHARHELIMYGWKMGAAHHAVTDRTQDTIWEYPRPARSDVHPTMKPVELVERSLANSTDHGQNVLDLFGGSGTTLIACERRERIAFLAELDPAYCDVIVDRWESYTGKTATREGATPEELEAAMGDRRRRNFGS